MKYLAIFTVLLISINSLYSASSTLERKQKVDLHNYLSEQARLKNFHGSVLVEKNGIIIIQNGYGIANAKRGKYNSPDTTFPIGSITKQFISISIMMLAKAGKLRVDDKISLYLSEFDNSEITIKHLLTHRSGLERPLAGNNDFDKKLFNLPIDQFLLKNIVGIISKEPLVSSPGEVFSYNNSGYITLSYLIEKISKMKIESFLERNIFRPLGMNNTGPSLVNGVRMYDAQGHKGYLESTPSDEVIDQKIFALSFGSGFLKSNIIDLQKWLVALENDLFVDKESKEEMFFPHTKIEGMETLNKYDYGYGWFVNSDRNNVAHGGNSPSFTGFVSKYLKENINIVILTNKEMIITSEGIELENISRGIFKLLEK